MTGSAAPAERWGALALRSRAEVVEAARELDAHAWSWKRRGRALTRAWRAAADLGLTSYPLERDRTKSWDVWRAVRHLLATVRPDGLVLDVGAWQSEVLWALRRAGFTSLEGCDTDPRVRRMPGDGITYLVGDFFEADVAPRSLAALTCLSVLEHGMDAEAFFSRAAGLLAPGGRLLLTTDYWPQPLDTTGLEAFGRPWHIGSRADAERWIGVAETLGLRPDGPVDLEAREAPITWNGRSYTFLWLAFAAED